MWAGASVADKMLTEECFHVRCEGSHGSFSLRKVFGNDSDVAQKLRRGFQVPVGSVDIDVTQIGSQGQHVLPDSLTASWRRLQCPNCKRMTKLMNTWPSTAGGLDPCGFQQGPEHAVNFPVDERLSFVRNKDMVATAPAFLDAASSSERALSTAVSCNGTNRVF